MRHTRRLLWWIVSVVALCALMGGVYGQRVEATAASGSTSSVRANMEEFTRVYGVVESHYAKPVDPDQAIYGIDPAKGIYGPSNVGAIPGMLRTLDPHSNFFDPRAFERLRELQTNKYYGVGMSIGARLVKGVFSTFVVSPFPGSPAFRAGLRPGDEIVKVDDKPTEGMQMGRVANLLKGPKGTQVHVWVKREGSAQPIEFTITRAQVSQPTVYPAFMIQPGVAYIRLNSFDETTDDELGAALERLGQNNFRGLILDLRDNTGGLLTEAVDVCDHFLAKGQLIVYHYGRRSEKVSYEATHGNHGLDYPIVVLINRYTASAAEIVTGALQDHDRALIMGEPSFGKGLVQTVFPLSEHAGLALTTAHYYTPSGRLIQRNYDDVSLYDYYQRFENGPTPHEQVKVTDGGRQVYGGGGITPDVMVAALKLNPAEQKMTDDGVFPDFRLHYLGVHKMIPRDFQANDAAVREFEQYIAENKIPISRKEVEDNLAFVKRHIRLQLVGAVYGMIEAETIKEEDDPLVTKAVQELPQAAQLLTNARHYMASKGDQ